MTDSTSSKLLVLALAAAAGLRFYALGAGSLQVDEAMSWLSALQWRTNPHFDVHPPLFGMLLGGWAQISLAEAWLRSLPVLASLASLAAWWFLARSLGLSLSLRLGVTVMLGLSFADIQQARELRMYSLLSLFSISCLAAVARDRWWLAGGALLAACFTHLFGLLLIPIAAFGTAHRRRWAAVAGLAVSLWLVWAVPHYRAHEGHPFELRGRPELATAVEAVGRLAAGRIAAFGDGPSLLLGAAGLLWLLWRRPPLVPLLYAWALLPWAGLWLLSRFTPVQLFEFKYLIWTLPAWSALWLASVPEGRGRAAMLVVWAALNLWGCLPWLSQPHRWLADWRGVANLCGRQSLPVVVHPSMMSAPLLFYGLGGPGLTGVDEWNQMVPAKPMLWVTTPHHPYVGQQRLLDGVKRYWKLEQQERFDSELPSSVVDVSRWSWAATRRL